MPGPAGVSRADILQLLRDGRSNREIGRILHTNPLRVGRIRKEYGLPAAQRRHVLTVEQKWATFTKPADDGHLDWIGHRREGVTPMFMLRGHNYSARRIAFGIAHGREPEGRVLPGCGRPECVAPGHVEDRAMRLRYQAIFGRAA